jgi:hypothetical protein
MDPTLSRGILSGGRGQGVTAWRPEPKMSGVAVRSRAAEAWWAFGYPSVRAAATGKDLTFADASRTRRSKLAPWERLKRFCSCA